jgi:hypothetical protein
VSAISKLGIQKIENSLSDYLIDPAIGKTRFAKIYMKFRRNYILIIIIIILIII